MADFRDSKGGICEPTGPVKQHIGDTYINLHPTEKFPLPHQIPPSPRNFTGREEIVDQILTGFNQGYTMICLRGTGGLGKTALAYKLADLLRDRYKDGQLMVKLQGTSPNPLTPAQSMSKLLRHYYPAVSLPENEEDLQSLYLSTFDGKCVLVLLDNALDDHQVRPLLLPATCGLIITSRRKFAVSGMIPIDLDILKLEEAVEFLVKTARPHSSKPMTQEESAWEKIARMCGLLPVALKAAGSYLACTPGSSPTQYVKELRNERKRLGIIGKEGVEEDLVTKLSLSYNRLLPETAQVFRLLSIFPADFDAKADEVICQDEGHWHLSELVRWSLVEYQKSGEESEGRYYLHDLVRLFAAERLEETGGEAARKNAQQRHSEHFNEVLSSATRLYQNGETLSGLESFDRERMNIEAGWEWAKKYLMDNNAAAALCNAFLNLPYLLVLRMHPRELTSWLETAVAAARSLMDRSAEGRHLGNLGNAHSNLGETRKAIKHYEKALAISREIGDRRIEGVDLGNLGNAYADLGETRKAIEYYEQALAIARVMKDRRNEGNFLGNLGLVYADLDEIQKALEFNQHSLAIAREIGDRRGEGNSLASLGIVFKNMGEPRKAIEHYTQALAIAREIGDRRGEGNSLGSLGIVYNNIGDPRKAIEHNDQALTIFREIWDRRGEGNALWNTSLAQECLGKRSEAVKLAKEALAIYEQIESPMAETVRRKLAEWQI